MKIDTIVYISNTNSNAFGPPMTNLDFFLNICFLGGGVGIHQDHKLHCFDEKLAFLCKQKIKMQI